MTIMPNSLEVQERSKRQSAALIKLKEEPKEEPKEESRKMKNLSLARRFALNGKFNDSLQNAALSGPGFITAMRLLLKRVGSS